MSANDENILLLVNPISGDIDKDPIVETIKTKINTASNLHIYKTTGENDEQQLTSEYSSDTIDRVLVLGGDGTIRLAVNLFLQTNVVLGIIPGGSSNGIATDLHIPENVDEAIKIALGQHTKKIDVLSFTSNSFSNKIGIHISDFGLNAELIKEYENSGIRGKVGYAINSVPALFKSEAPYHFTVTTDQKSQEHTAVMIAFANSKKFGTGAVINPNGNMSDGVFEIIIFKQVAISDTFKILAAKEDPDFSSIEIISTKNAEIELTTPIAFQIDGEYCGEASSLTISIIPEAIEVLIPK